MILEIIFLSLFGMRNQINLNHCICYRVHEGIRDVQCSECGKFFREQADLNSHIRKVHTKTSRLLIPCENCEKTYNTVSALRSHMRSVHQMFVPWTPEEINE